MTSMMRFDFLLSFGRGLCGWLAGAHRIGVLFRIMAMAV
jgi:hypothetical protein